MRKIFVSSIILVCLMAVSASAFSGTERWQAKLDSPMTTCAAVSGNRIFLGTESGNVYAVNANTGRVIWMSEGENRVLGTPSVVGNIVVFARGSGEIVALNVHDGKLVWVTGGNGGRDAQGNEVSDTVSDGTVAGGGLVYVSKNDCKVHALREKDGKTAWTYTTGDSGVRVAPAYSNGLVFVGEYDCIFSILDAKTGKRLNGGGAGGPILTPTAANGNVYFSSWDGSVNAVKIDGVIPLWNVNVGDAISTQPEVASGKIVVGTSSGAVVALDEKTGRTLWKFDTEKGNIAAKPVIADGVVFVSPGSGGVFVLDLNTGKQAGRIADESGVVANPSYHDGVLYYAKNDTLTAAE